MKTEKYKQNLCKTTICSTKLMSLTSGSKTEKKTFFDIKVVKMYCGFT